MFNAFSIVSISIKVSYIKHAESPGGSFLRGFFMERPRYVDTLVWAD